MARFPPPPDRRVCRGCDGVMEKKTNETEIEFVPFPKIPRLKRGCVITEKIDGTNACVRIVGDRVISQSRSRILSVADDNFGFARWVEDHKAELLSLGEGCHFGEWWGAGIQRRYGLTEKRFSLFNVGRWNAETPPPPCCSMVPILYQGDFDTGAIDRAIEMLRKEGSKAAPGFMKPEGIIVYHVASRCYFKGDYILD